MKRVLISAFAALLVTVSMVAVAGWNRSGEPRLRITLTERELRLPYIRAQSGDDPGLQLRLEFEGRRDPLDARNWLTEDRLRALGFAMEVEPGAPDAERTYGGTLPRVAWVAFEYNGDAWREIERRRALAPPRHEGQEPEPSHLVPVDASSSADELFARYPAGHLIMRAVIQLAYVPPQQRGPLVYGYVSAVIPAVVHVPRELSDALNGLTPSAGAPRYEVDLAVGRLGIPYVTAVRREGLLDQNSK